MRLIDQSLLKTALPLENRREGKVRDIYDLVLPDNSPGVLIVATDRVSVFDVVLGNGIPEKGIMLTQISKFWFELLADVVENHPLRISLRVNAVTLHISWIGGHRLQ